MTLTPIFSTIASLAAVLVLILVIGRVLRTTRTMRLRGGATQRLRVLESLSIDPKRRVVLLECDGRSVLLLTGVQDQVVGWLPEAAP